MDERRAVDFGFWRDRKVFLTGHTGFKGAWLSLWLHHLGARVTGFALEPPTDPNLFDLAGVAGHLWDLRGDIRDVEALDAALRESQAEIVLHLAAQSLVRASYADPVTTYDTNVMGTVRLLEAVRHAPSVRAVVVVTSDKCYENREWSRGYREDDAMGGHDPYSSSKGCAELVTSAYRRSFFQDQEGRIVRIATARAGNVIGGGDWAQDRLLPDLMRAFSEGRPAVIRNPLATRPWQHVLEPLHGYLMLAERLHAGDGEVASGWNFGPQETGVKPVSWVADEAIRNWGGSAKWEQDRGAHPHEARALKLDISRAESGLGWSPELDPAEAVAWTVRWFQGIRNGEGARELVMRDICDYVERISAENGRS